MLKIWIGPNSPNYVRHTKDYFKINKKKEWFNNDFVKKVIKGVDNSEHIKDEYIESPVLGAIPSLLLSSGCKNLIILYNVDNINLYCSGCGDNCAEYIVELAKSKDITITLFHPIKFPNEFRAVIMNDNTVVTNYFDFIMKYYEVLDKEYD